MESVLACIEGVASLAILKVYTWIRHLQRFDVFCEIRLSRLYQAAALPYSDNADCRVTSESI